MFLIPQWIVLSLVSEKWPFTKKKSTEKVEFATEFASQLLRIGMDQKWSDLSLT